MNSTIEEIFSDYYVPVSFLRYDGNETTYITYMETEKDGVLAGDNEIIGYIDYYDFDIYSKGNYLSIVEDVKSRLKANGFTWQPSRDSQDLYEDDTGYSHKTLCFAIERQEV